MTDSARVKKLARQFMQTHPGVRYQQALATVVAATSAAPTEQDWLRLVGGVPSRDALADRWSTTLTSHHLRWPVGTHPGSGGAAQPVWVDLAQPSLGGDGTHAAIVGWGPDTLGVVETLLIGLAAWHGPERLRFVVAGCPVGLAAKLPHLVADDLEPVHRRPEALVELLRRELRDREEELRRTHCGDIHAHRERAAQVGGAALPDLLIVLADLDVLTDAHPVVAEVVEVVARRGRSLGMHLVVSTESPSPASSQAWRRLAHQFEVLLLGPDSTGWPLSADIPSSPADPATTGTGRVWIAHRPKGHQSTSVQVFPEPKSGHTRDLCRVISAPLEATGGVAGGGQEERIWAEAGDWGCGDGPYLIVQNGLYHDGVLLESPSTIASLPLRDRSDRQEIDAALAVVGFCADWEQPVEPTEYGIAFAVSAV